MFSDVIKRNVAIKSVEAQKKAKCLYTKKKKQQKQIRKTSTPTKSRRYRAKLKKNTLSNL